MLFAYELNGRFAPIAVGHQGIRVQRQSAASPGNSATVP